MTAPSLTSHWPAPTLPLGAGLGFRRELIEALRAQPGLRPDFFEIAPENWIGQGGRSARDLREFTERHPFVCHGLSLSLGGPAALDTDLLKAVRTFMDSHGIGLYTEHLSWCGDSGMLCELLPIPLTAEAVRWTAGRIRQAQDILGQRIAIENPSYYLIPPGAEMSEAEFIGAVLEEADCLLHLDINNVYVNSQNFATDPQQLLAALPLWRTAYVHIAGHYTEDDGFLLDTHGNTVADPVWRLLEDTLPALPAQVPICLERDFNFPPLPSLMAEVARIATLQAAHRPALAA